MGVSGGGGMQNNYCRVNPIINSTLSCCSFVRLPPQPSDMATAFSCKFKKIWPPDLGKSSGVEERSLTAHRISEDPSRFRFRMLKQALTYSSLKVMMHLLVLYAA
ncbi:hypothetical protein HanRHA438_Chr05g0229691 [Helianthus annuus]|uniref:Uncharacterized protein n=1 Tax=Helianthus annuus TaxID=4232 RepID=A0A9K3NN35_HELAN|nr:hypothetical protein HanXRQr2_Chr05g0220851 [Helianthus annuus]KAJ0577562.1 hypothetical protein HanIR_Chr05g0237401 [Helianthus annuus]KAJ0919442.1 hypothetical protein HanRHA438_Chr05g0229691 [Helianthus annuus]KAJ0923229.1 hypothetical protein HanPSC8_Chr05g0213331 [Helianthus annuus]